MKDKQTYLTKGSFALLLFVILGYVVKFYPEQLVTLDSSVQTAIRGDLPETLTLIFREITRLIDLPIVSVRKCFRSAGSARPHGKSPPWPMARLVS